MANVPLSDVRNLIDTSGVEAALEALTAHLPYDVPGPEGVSVGARLAAIAKREDVGVRFDVNEGRLVSNDDGSPADAVGVLHAVLDRIEGVDRADDADDLDANAIEGGATAHSDPEVPPPSGIPPFAGTSGADY